MAIAHLVTQKVQEVHFTNKLTKQGQIQLDASFTFHVNFAKDGERCIAKVYQSIKDKENSDQLFVSVDIIGAFACKDVVTEEDKKQIHASGIPGFQLRKAVIDPANVQVGQPPHAAEPEKPQFPIV
jgi:hypothetical protein